MEVNMLTKEEFVKILNRMREVNDLENKIDDLITKSREAMMNDFINGYGFMVNFEDIIVDLLEKLMQDAYGDISYFMYELDYGRSYTEGDITDKDGNIVDFSTAEKLYDYLIEQMENNNEKNNEERSEM